jgi:predicted heme/steroid binding protein
VVRPYAVVVISWDGRTRKLVVQGRPVDTASVAPSGSGWTATLDVARRVEIRLRADAPSVERVELDLWQRPTSAEIGVAVIAARGEPAGLAVIPVCDCGEHGCANAGRQLAGPVDADELHATIDLLSHLPVVGSLSRDQPIWQLGRD